MALRLYNTLTKRLEEFTPGDPAHVTFYSCGPTVYDDAHIGNFRSFLAADVLRRFIESPLCALANETAEQAKAREQNGRRVTHVMNITDVGHMTDDAEGGEAGEDRMAVAGRRLLEAKKTGKLPADAKIDPGDPYAIAEFYANRFLEDARTLGLKVAVEATIDAPGRRRDPTLMPRPSQMIPGIVGMILELLARGHAYSVGDPGRQVVYFDVQSFRDRQGKLLYGSLSGNSLDKLLAGAGGRISDANQAQKRHPADFLLWKADASHIMKWNPAEYDARARWGAGYPGWHIECSVMAASRLISASLSLSNTILRGIAEKLGLGSLLANHQAWWAICEALLGTVRNGDWGRVEPSTSQLRQIALALLTFIAPLGSAKLARESTPHPHLGKPPRQSGLSHKLQDLLLGFAVRHDIATASRVIDLHSGGEDNIFPHHECEIAQSRCAHGTERFARLWFHGRHLLVNGDKMSKSKGNFYTIRDLLALGYEPAAIRLELIRTHHTMNANFTLDGLRDAARMVERWRRVAQVQAGDEPVEPSLGTREMLSHFSAAMSNDMNVADAIGAINTWVSRAGDPRAGDSAAFKQLDAVLGILALEKPKSASTDIGIFLPGTTPDAAVIARLEARRDAKARKDFKASDAIRDELAAMGLAIKDVAGGKVEVSRR